MFSEQNVILLFLLVLRQLSKIYGKVYCGEEGVYGLCYNQQWRIFDLQTYVSACPEDEYCPKEEIRAVIACSKKGKISDVGGKCKAGVDCFSGICINNVCTELNVGEECWFDEDCDKKSICSIDGVCENMKFENSDCSFTTDCRLGLECINGQCLKIGTGADGDIVLSSEGCASGYNIEKDDQLICVTLKDTNKTCLESKDDTKYYCYGNISDGTSLLPGRLECIQTWNDTYICPSEKTEAFQNYLDAFTETLATLKEGDYNRIINRYYLNTHLLGGYYLDYTRYEKVHGASDCIRRYYYQLLWNTLNVSYSTIIFPSLIWLLVFHLSVF